MRTSFNITVDIVIFNNDNVLLIKRKNDPFKDCWAFPGGYVDEGETFEEAAIRELKEETCLSIKNLMFVGIQDAVDRDPRGRVIGISFSAMCNDITEAKASDDAKELAWFNIDDVYRKKIPLAFDHRDIFYNAYETMLK